MPIKINQELCKGCGVCVGVCPKGAIFMREGKAYINQAKCSTCQICIDVCPVGAIKLESPMTLEGSENHHGNASLVPRTSTKASISNSKPAAFASAVQFIFPYFLDIFERLVSKGSFNSKHNHTNENFNSANSHMYKRRKRKHKHF